MKITDDERYSIIKHLLIKLKENEIPNNSLLLDNELMRSLLLLKVSIISGYNYFKLDENMIPFLEKFDLKDFDFTNVSVSSINFTDTNANINPQTVYDKNMSYGKYPLDFTGKSFEGVNVRGADFTGATNVNVDTRTPLQKIDDEIKRVRVKK